MSIDDEWEIVKPCPTCGRLVTWYYTGDLLNVVDCPDWKRMNG